MKKLDFTEEKLFTLNQDTIGVLDNLKEPVTAKLYFSNILSKRHPKFRLCDCAPTGLMDNE